MSNDSLGDRMKEYENAYCIHLPHRLPLIIRLDMRAGHTYTKNFKRPFDTTFHIAMVETAEALCQEVNGCKLAYTQSDEISLVVTNNDTITTQPWFDNKLQKIVSLSAAFATIAFHKAMNWQCDAFYNFGNYKEDLLYSEGLGRVMFDSRAFILPEYEVANYLIWRQQDATRNSIQMAARSVYSHKELMNKNSNELQEMLFQRGINWNNYEVWMKRGSCIVKKPVSEPVEYQDTSGKIINQTVCRMRWQEDTNTPIFTENKKYITDKLIVGEENNAFKI